MVIVCGCIIIATIVINRKKKLKQNQKGQRPPTHVMVSSVDFSVGDQHQQRNSDMIIGQELVTKCQNTFGEFDDEVIEDETLGMEMEYNDDEEYEDKDVNTNGFIGDGLETVVDVDVNNEEIEIKTKGLSARNVIADDEFIISNDGTLQ